MTEINFRHLRDCVPANAGTDTPAPLPKRLEKRGPITRSRLESNERKLFLSLTEQGEGLKERALAVPRAMRDGIGLEEEEMRLLKQLLNKALQKMEERA